jgi:CDP-diacylglycerol--glycerol-3-phosphate 3-phosphatidyltransferase
MKRLTLATYITLLRIVVVVPFLVGLYYQKVTSWQGIIGGFCFVIIFTLISLTDKVDGYIARKYDQVTDLGKLLDPIADKILIGSTLIVLSVLDVVPFWATGIILLRETLLSLWRTFYITQHRVVVPASNFGKVKTVIQSVTVGFFIAPLNLLPNFVTIIAFALLIVTISITAFSGIHYLISHRNQLKSGAKSE